MFAVATQNLALNKLPFNWFDVALVGLIAFGLFRGRKNGMSKEMLPFFLWLVLVLACAFIYNPIAQVLINFAKMPDNAVTYVLAYLIVAGLVLLIFSLIKNHYREKLGGSNFFGGGEYYLGMMSGLVRYLCITFFLLALLNAPVYTAADIARSKAYNARWFGGGEKGFSGDYFPTLQTVQASVFKDSFSGPYIKNYMSAMLINTAPSSEDNNLTAAQQKKPIIHIGN
jgi:uncharacterized membrane protein required for colicin V production